ncbi:lipoprotein signal peptidase [Spirochaetia bacterium]|nr:lipoprotein signal peptidase [Spirochaetia bacterium]
MKLEKARILPLTLTGIVILADQAVKSFIVKNWPREGTFIKDVFNNDILYIYHVRNKAIAFSLGGNIPEILKPVLFIVLPLLVLGFLLWYYLKSDEFTLVQRWAAAGIIGGGIGNIIDRIFRPAGVVDFISFKFFGLQNLKGPLAFLSWDRWPTFNIADSSVVVCCILLFITLLISSKKTESGAAQ